MELGIPSNLTLWQLLNAPIASTVVTLFLAVIGWRISYSLTRQRINSDNAIKAEERRKTLLAEEKLAQRHSSEELETVASTEEDVQETAITDYDNARRRMRDAYDKINRQIERIVKTISDGRIRNKYQNRDKRDLRTHVYLLWQDDFLPERVADEIDQALTSYYSYRNGRNQVPEDVVTAVERAADRFEVIADL